MSSTLLSLLNARSGSLRVDLASAIIAIVIGFGIYRLLQIGRRPADIPPGPPTLPVLGRSLP
jgi:lipopolysaccharide export LptBFGC system permease protein LptF